MDRLVSSEWLAARLSDNSVAVLDASLHLPATGRDAREEFCDAHIAGARFLDLASLTDKTSPVPAALPNANGLAERLAALGIEKSQEIVLYDDSDVKTSARAWFAMTSLGLREVAVLDGGLGKWRREDRPISNDCSRTEHGEPMSFAPATHVATKAEMLANLDNSEWQVLDARSADRVYGTGTDPVHGGQNGRIPGSLNLPFGKVFNEDGTYKSPEQLRALFAEAGVDLNRPLVTTCGSGVTASVLLFAAHFAGKHDVYLYDGSWLEWEADPDTPKEQGPA